MENKESDKNPPLWEFLRDGRGSFISVNPDQTSRLYFPLMNEAGMKSFVTPELKGDICAAFDQYLTVPVVTEDLHRTLNSRYFWVRMEGFPPWSINGLGSWQQSLKWEENAEQSEITARPGTFTLQRPHPLVPLETEITIIVPAVSDRVELWQVRLQNKGTKTLRISPFAVLPLFGRHADNLRDHRQVTTMFQECYRNPFGVRVKPKIIHDETGHKVNNTSYFVYGCDGEGNRPERIWSRMQDFIGEGGNLANPEAIWKNLPEPEIPEGHRHGKEAVAALSFKEIGLEPGSEAIYQVVVGITDEDDDNQIFERYNSPGKFLKAWEMTDAYWSGLTDSVTFRTGQAEFDEWSNWLAFQLKCRQLFGNSYLPDFGYGRGGRGWRDLWQDLLSIFLVDPGSAKEEMINNLKGIRIDGSNATIVGTRPGEFKADRNNIPRTWCDHGAWPLYAIHFYIQQTGDFQILREEIEYWKDQHVNRNRAIDALWGPGDGNRLATSGGEPYKGSVLEHLIVQQLSAFYHVGEHNILLLEGADWNDTLDMAKERGESVCFQSFYAGNFEILAVLLGEMERNGTDSIRLLKEIMPLLDRLPGQQPIDYQSIEQKRATLESYFDHVGNRISGELVAIRTKDLIADFNAKRNHLADQVRKNEWIDLSGGMGFFNGHYDNLGKRVHGVFEKGIRMDLTSQVMPVMFNIADNTQIDSLFASAVATLGDAASPGLKLCTPFPGIDMNIGRITGFVYGYKEYGSKWMQQNIMLMNALYARKRPGLAFRLFRDIFSLVMDSRASKTFPGIPSYYEPGDRGAYMYLTGSSTWMFLSLVTQVFGARGEWGDLVIEPKLAPWFFSDQGTAGIEFHFQGRRIRLTYLNPSGLNAGEYQIRELKASQTTLFKGASAWVTVDGERIRNSAEDPINLTVLLG